jgi:hypothetical protein
MGVMLGVATIVRRALLDERGDLGEETLVN